MAGAAPVAEALVGCVPGADSSASVVASLEALALAVARRSSSWCCKRASCSSLYRCTVGTGLRSDQPSPGWWLDMVDDDGQKVGIVEMKVGSMARREGRAADDGGGNRGGRCDEQVTGQV